MEKNENTYAPPKAKVYQFDDNDRILTESGGGGDVPTPEPTGEFAANALNEFMGGTNTTIEIQ